MGTGTILVAFNDPCHPLNPGVTWIWPGRKGRSKVPPEKSKHHGSFSFSKWGTKKKTSWNTGCLNPKGSRHVLRRGIYHYNPNDLGMGFRMVNLWSLHNSVGNVIPDKYPKQRPGARPFQWSTGINRDQNKHQWGIFHRHGKMGLVYFAYING